MTPKLFRLDTKLERKIKNSDVIIAHFNRPNWKLFRESEQNRIDTLFRRRKGYP